MTTTKKEEPTTPTALTTLTDEQIEALTNPRIKEILKLARKLGIEKADVDFNGSGDSGSIECVDLGITELILDPSSLNRDSKLITNPLWTEDHKKLEELLDTEAESNINGTDYDYYNGDGGGGHLTFDLLTGRAFLSLYQYETNRCNEEDMDLDLTTENPKE